MQAGSLDNQRLDLFLRMMFELELSPVRKHGFARTGEAIRVQIWIIKNFADTKKIQREHKLGKFADDFLDWMYTEHENASSPF